MRLKNRLSARVHLLKAEIARVSETAVHEIIELKTLGQRLAAQSYRARAPFSLKRIVRKRFLVMEKGPTKTFELREKPQPTSARLQPAERTGVVEKWARRVHRAGKVRLFRLWKMLAPELLAGAPTRPFAEHLAWLRRSRRL